MQKEIKEGHTFIHYGQIDYVSYTTEIYTDSQSLDEIIQRFKEYLLGVGFKKESVDTYFSCE